VSKTLKSFNSSIKRRSLNLKNSLEINLQFLKIKSIHDLIIYLKFTRNF